jgi:diguanylate cyclase (GGDEF)-like protein
MLGDRPRRLQALVVLVLGLGAAALVVSLAAAAHTAHPKAGHLILAGALLAAGDLAVLHLRFGRERFSFTWSEASVIFGLVLVPWPWLTIVAACSVALAHTFAGRSPLKIAFNAATMTAATSMARLVTELFGGPHPDSSVKQWVVLSLAASVCFAYNVAAVSCAIAFSQEIPVRDVVLRGLGMKLAVFTGNTTLALLLISVTWNAAAVAAVPLFIVLLYTAYRGYLTVDEDRETWRGLDAATKALAELDVDVVAWQAIEHAASLLRADAAELFVRQGGSEVGHYAMQPDGNSIYDVLDDAVLMAMDLRAGAVTSSVHHEDSTEALPFTLTVALEAGPRSIGALRLRFRGGVQLNDRERKVLLTLSRSVSMNLNNALLFESVRAAAARHEYDATHDPLTDLPNRTLLMRTAATAAAAAVPDRCLALLLLDLDHFKTINDTLGHNTGDRLLVSAAQRLQETVRDGDVIARLGGDEFAILLTNLRRPDDADNVAADVLEALSVPVSIDGLRLSVEGSIGISCMPTDAADVTELLAHADVALYQAKTSRGTHRRYRADRDETSISRLALAAELRTALRDDQLVLHYQPQHRLSDGTIMGAEALVRWQHPTRGLLAPQEFIAVAEDSGLAHEFTREVLTKAVREAAHWRAMGHTEVHLAVNLSARNLLDEDLPRTVRQVLDAYSLPPETLILEITETTMMSELDLIEQTLRGLRRLGVQLAVDDFGTGYSSLTFLTRNAVNELKIDRGFVQRMLTSESDAAVVRATIDLGHGLGLRVVAEGVEDAATLAAIADLNCDGAQGFLLDRPMPAAEMRSRLGGTSIPLPLRGLRQRTAEQATSVALTAP